MITENVSQVTSPPNTSAEAPVVEPTSAGESVDVTPPTVDTQPSAAQGDQGAKPADAVDSAATPDPAGMSSDQLLVFEALWQLAVPSGEDLLGPTAAVNFFRSSGYDNQVLSKIWSLSDSQAPKGQLCKEEFFIALKLIALKQAGQAPSIDAAMAVTEIPDLGDNTTKAKATVAAAGAIAEEVSTTETASEAPTPAAALTFLQVMANMWAKMSDKVDGAGTVDGAACRPVNRKL